MKSSTPTTNSHWMVRIFNVFWHIAAAGGMF
jgi:hypothetical protein